MKNSQFFPVSAGFERVTGIRPADGTWRRWRLAGVMGPNGRRRLNTTKVGGRIMVTEDAVREFLLATNQPLHTAKRTSVNGSASIAEAYLDVEFANEKE